MIAAGFDNGDIKMFDLKNMKLQWSTNVNNGVCSLQFDRMGECDVDFFNFFESLKSYCFFFNIF